MRLLKQVILLLPMLLLLQTYGSGSIVLAQQDSTKLSLSELKQIAGLLPELQKRREINVTFNDKEMVYKSIVKGYQNDEELYKKQIENLKLNIEAVKPAWYDNFWTGSAITAIVISSIYFLTK